MRAQRSDVYRGRRPGERRSALRGENCEDGRACEADDRRCM